MLYTSLDIKIVDAVIKPFKDKHGIDVQYYRGGSNDVTSKVLSEAAAGRLQVDMVDASDLAAVLLMKERGLLKPFRVRTPNRPLQPSCVTRIRLGLQIASRRRSSNTTPRNSVPSRRRPGRT